MMRDSSMTHRLISLFILLSCFSAFADTYYVEPATGSGVDDSDLTTTTELIRTAVNASTGNQTTDDKTQTKLFLRPRILKLGHSFVLELDKVDSGKIVYSSQMKAAAIEELDKVATRLTQAVLSGRQASQDTRVGEITEQEAHDGTQRKPSRKFTYLGFGTAFFHNLNVGGAGYSLGAAFGWDVNIAMIKIMGDFSILQGAIFSDIALEGMLFLSERDTAPYVSADFGLGISRQSPSGGNSDVNAGFAAGVGVGVLFLRTSSISLDLGARLNLIFNSNSEGDPLVGTIRIGVCF
jgi:hypothetical protein